MSKSYCNWHAHSMGSMLDGISKFEEYMERAAELGMPGATFTDHGNLHSLIHAYKAAEGFGLKYFPGMEAYQARKTRFDRDDEERAAGGANEWGQKGPHHLGLIAYNNEGYQNLLKLSSLAYTDGFYVKPRLDEELLSQYSGGLVVLSGCLSSKIQQALTRGDFDEAVRIAANFQDIVGKDNFYIEMMNHGIDLELANHECLSMIADIIGAKIIATQDSHYTYKHQASSHDLCLCVNTGARIDTPDRFHFTGEYHLKSYEEMAELFPEEWLDNTLDIYDKHDFKLQFGKYHIPNFPVSEGKTQEEDFLEKTYAGAEYRFGKDWRENKPVVERIEYEINVIKDMGFPNYFLIVEDLVGEARRRKIMVGAGRGSAAGSMVAYCLQITQVNPLKHDLPFERFLVPGRPSMPDIDLDFDDRFRDEMIEYAQEKYGHDHMAYICNFSELNAKSAVKDVARVLNYPFEFGKKINDSMPPALFGVSKTLTECLATEGFRKLYDEDEDIKTVVDAAITLEGVWRQTGVHASGLVISDRPLTDYVPVMQKGDDAPIITQWDGTTVEKLGLIKVDFLGLRNLSIVDMAIEIIEKAHDARFPENRYELVDDADPEVFQALSRGENVIVFQMESGGIRSLMTGLKPENLDDVSAILALYRPGPMASNVHNEFVARKHKHHSTIFLHPALKPILADTYGLLLYQEQIMRITNEICGFNVGETDDFRKIVGKKIVKEMPKQRKSFVNGAMKTTGFTEGEANKLFDEIEHHASYSFSKNHAYGYAYTTYLTSYFRTHYPLETLAAALSSVGNKEERLRLYLSECKRMGFEVVPPSISKSGVDFNPVDGKILYGFNAVKGIGEVLANILGSKDAARDYENVFDFLRRVDNRLLNRDTINHFLSAGCFDELLTNMKIPQPDLTRQEKLQMMYEELNELGVFLSDHPFNDVQDLIAGKTTHTIEQLKEGYDDEKVKVAGVVIGVKAKMTKTGKKIWNLVIDDLDGSINATITSKLSSELPDPPVSKGDIIIIFGKLIRNGDDENAALELLVFGIDKIDDGYLVGGKAITLTAKHELSMDQLNRIAAIIESSQGNSPVYLEYQDGQQEIKIKFNGMINRDKQETLQLLVEV